MKIAFAATEAVPYAKTGGLADVAGTLPKALEKLGCEVKIFIPKYSTIDEENFGLDYRWDIGEMPIRVGSHVRQAHLHKVIMSNSNVEVNFIDCPHYFFRGRIYTDDPDEDERFILFSKSVIESLQRMQWAPDVIHCNDWQTGLIPLYIKDNYSWDKLFEQTKTLFTIHNIGYQGRFAPSTLAHAEINEDLYYPDGPVEHAGTVSFMKAGISFADIINTVSKTYAEEILTPELGAGMETILSKRKSSLFGILNGVDYSTWNPATDKFLPHHYSPDDLSGKEENKKYLLEHFNMSYIPGMPLIGMVSRLASQKGFDIFADAIEGLMSLEAQWILLGNGEEKYEDLFQTLANVYPEKVGSFIGFNNQLSHLIEAGSDIFLMPSHYEPCGLNQIYSLKYGTVPVVRKTGGLADTVQDWNEYNDDAIGDGFTFTDYSGHALYSAVKRAIDTYPHKNSWRKIQLNGMRRDYSWEHSAQEYIKLYNIALGKIVKDF